MTDTTSTPSARPKTLLEMAGAPQTPAPWSQSVLVLIDCQEIYRTGPLPLTGIEAALEDAAVLLAAAREHGCPVIHVVHHGRPGSPFDPAGPWVEICDAVAPQGNEPVVVKTMANGFTKTTLDETIKAHGGQGDDARNTLIVAGFMTHNCVSSTVRGAIDHGYRCTMVASACGTRPLPNPLAGQDGEPDVLDAATLNRAILGGLADTHGLVIPSVAALKAALAADA